MGAGALDGGHHRQRPCSVSRSRRPPPPCGPWRMRRTAQLTLGGTSEEKAPVASPGLHPPGFPPLRPSPHADSDSAIPVCTLPRRRGR